MTTFETLQIILQSVVLVGVLATLVIYYRQLRAMTRQLEIARQSSSAQNFISAINYLQAEHVREARTVVLTKLATQNVFEWTESDRLSASTVCSTYDVAAILVQMGLIIEQPFVENWGPSIRNCYRILAPFIEQMQRPDRGGQHYWNNFKWLADESEKLFGDHSNSLSERLT